MAITMEASYWKKVGLPGTSSHRYRITLRTELADLSQVAAESVRLHALLQASVDQEIQKVGFLPANQNGNGNRDGQHPAADNDAWNCSSKQKALIQRIVSENGLDEHEVQALAQERFGKAVKVLNKLEASGLIEELLEKTGRNRGNGRDRFQGRYQRTGAR